MKKVIRLSESDLVRLVKRLINEQFHSEIDTTPKSGENEVELAKSSQQLVRELTL